MNRKGRNVREEDNGEIRLPQRTALATEGNCAAITEQISAALFPAAQWASGGTHMGLAYRTADLGSAPYPLPALSLRGYAIIADTLGWIRAFTGQQRKSLTNR